MNKEEQRKATEIDMQEYENGTMDYRSPRYRLNKYIECFPADPWLCHMIHKYNEIRRSREE